MGHGLARSGVNVRPNEFAISPVNGRGTFTIPAKHGKVVLSGFEWSYDGVPTGRIRIIAGGLEYINLDVRSSGLDDIDYDPPQMYPAETAVSLIIDPGGIGVTGKIRPKSWWVE